MAMGQNPAKKAALKNSWIFYGPSSPETAASAVLQNPFHLQRTKSIQVLLVKKKKHVFPQWIPLFLWDFEARHTSLLCSSAAWNLYAVRHGILDGNLGYGWNCSEKMGESYSWLINDYLWLMVDDYLWLMVRKYLSGWWLTWPTHLGKIFPSNPMKFPWNPHFLMVSIPYPNWLVVDLPLWKMMELVRQLGWFFQIWWESHKNSMVPNHQPV